MKLIIPLTKEEELNEYYDQKLDVFWQKGEFNEFIGVDNAHIKFAKFTKGTNTQTILISPGRSESYLKYKELCFDLCRQNYNVFIIEHRGQGLSSRLLSNKRKGYVKSFDDYVEDLNTLIEKHIKLKPHLLAHSMGGAIGIMFMIKYPHKLASAALCAPLININSGFIPTWLGKSFIKLINSYDKCFNLEPNYFLGQKKYKLKPFETNKQSQSAKRYQRYINLYTELPYIQLGGVTTHWLNEALKIKEYIFNNIDKLATPITIIQSGSEAIVDNNAQEKLCEAINKQQPKACPMPKPFVIQGAFHELLFERDEYRDKTITHALQWFDDHKLN